MKENFVCHTCDRRYPLDSFVWKCECGGLLDLEKHKNQYSMENIKKQTPSMWRYIDAMPFEPTSTVWQTVTMGEGYTPMVELDAENPNVLVKMDYMMPTLSFKDRGAAVMIAKAKELGVKKVIADSSGNAGTAFAAYAKRAGIECDIYLRASTSPKKIKQIQAHGAKVCTIDGNRAQVAAAAQLAVEQEHTFYASHVHNPLFYEGTKTYAFEILEQLNRVPDTLIIPVGNGTLLLGAYYGFKELMAGGKITKMPRIIAVQAENCSPLAQAFNKGELEATPVEGGDTLAEGIAITAPHRHKQILEAIYETKGQIITTSEDEIKDARIALANKGFYVEPTTAANYAGFLKYERNHDETIIIPLCGAGIKAE